MSLRINTNVQSLVAQHRLSNATQSLNLTQQRLANGSRIVQPMDDAAGLAISEHLRATMRSTNQNIKNAQNGFYLLQTADGALNEVSNIIIRMKELSVQAASDTNADKERGYLDNEFQALKAELERITQTTMFNGRPLLNGMGGDVSIQVGPNNVEDQDRILIATGFESGLEALGVADFQIADQTGSRDTLEPIQAALDRIAFLRGAIGAGESRLNSTIRNLMNYEENVSAAFSQIRDADIAHETAELTKSQIITEAGTGVLAQANSTPKLALKLLG